MIFDQRDYEILRLCGLCRYLPTGLERRFAAPYFSPEAFASLREHGLIKQQSDNSSWKLTYDGRVILAKMGHEYAQDKRLDLKRPAYRRRLKNAMWNVMLFLAGIDVFLENASELAGMDIGYLSSLMLRTVGATLSNAAPRVMSRCARFWRSPLAMCFVRCSRRWSRFLCCRMRCSSSAHSF